MARPSGNQHQSEGIGIGLIMGVAFSLIFAMALDNWFLGAAIGMLSGLVIFGGLAYRRNR
jgi:hypothetical protein